MRRQYDWIVALLICAVLHFLQLMQVQPHTHVIFKLFPSLLYILCIMIARHFTKCYKVKLYQNTLGPRHSNRLLFRIMHLL